MSDTTTQAARAGRVRTPVQERSRQTYNKILAAATELIAEGGFDAFTTNAVAERAGVNIASLYAYFSDKYDILSELIRRTDEKRIETLSERMDQLNGSNWRDWLNSTIDHLFQMRLSEPGIVALRNAARGSARVDEEHLETTSASIAAAAKFLQQQSERLDPERAHIVARMVFTTTSEILDKASSTDTPDYDMVTELKVMVNSYLAPILDA